MNGNKYNWHFYIFSKLESFSQDFTKWRKNFLLGFSLFDILSPTFPAVTKKHLPVVGWMCQSNITGPFCQQWWDQPSPPSLLSAPFLCPPPTNYKYHYQPATTLFGVCSLEWKSIRRSIAMLWIDSSLPGRQWKITLKPCNSNLQCVFANLFPCFA